MVRPSGNRRQDYIADDSGPAPVYFTNSTTEYGTNGGDAANNHLPVHLQRSGDRQ